MILKLCLLSSKSPNVNSLSSDKKHKDDFISSCLVEPVGWLFISQSQKFITLPSTIVKCFVAFGFMKKCNAFTRHNTWKLVTWYKKWMQNKNLEKHIIYLNVFQEFKYMTLLFGWKYTVYLQETGMLCSFATSSVPKYNKKLYNRKALCKCQLLQSAWFLWNSIFYTYLHNSKRRNYKRVKTGNEISRAKLKKHHAFQDCLKMRAAYEGEMYQLHET